MRACVYASMDGMPTRTKRRTVEEEVVSHEGRARHAGAQLGHPPQQCLHRYVAVCLSACLSVCICEWCQEGQSLAWCGNASWAQAQASCSMRRGCTAAAQQALLRSSRACLRTTTMAKLRRQSNTQLIQPRTLWLAALRSSDEAALPAGASIYRSQKCWHQLTAAPPRAAPLAGYTRREAALLCRRLVGGV